MRRYGSCERLSLAILIVLYGNAETELKWLFTENNSQNAEIMIVKFLFVADDKIYCTRLLVAALLHGCTIRKDGIFAEIECRDWEHFGHCVWSAWARMSRTSEGSQIAKRRTVHVELPDFDDDVHVWYNLSDDHKRLMYGRA